MDFEGEEYYMYDEFEQEFAEELEMAANMEQDSKPTSATSSDRCNGMSRRNLSLTSPFQGGGGLSRKRPMECEDPLVSPGKKAKHPRLEESTPPHQDTPHSTATPSHSSHSHVVANGDFKTPSRRGLDSTTCPTSITRSTQQCTNDRKGLTSSHTSSSTPTSFKLTRDSVEDEDSYASMAADTHSYQSPHHIAQTGSHTEKQPPSQRSRNRPYALRRAPLGSHVSVTSSDGTRVYLKMSKSQRSESSWSFLSSQLLPVSISELREAVEEEQRQKLIQESNLLVQALRENVENEGSQVLFDGAEGESDSVDHVLWVDKYSPHNYTDLLSDDGINRTLLSWLRLWDEVVFNRPVPLKAAPPKPGGGGAKPPNRDTPKGKRFERRPEVQDPATFAGQDALDSSRRPNTKLALLCGAPGLGKTTLAHIIASHAGYNVVEMNASDDRSPEVFRQRIESATQMQAILMANTKPNCLVIDEIDGAPTAAINTLIDYVTRTAKTSGKKKGEVSNLSRPIICICNDQYAPSLRQLRQHALLLHFPPIVTSRLASRLHHVSRKEQLTATMSTLVALCEKTSNDVRSCLNTIQFLGRKSKEISLGSVQAASIGQKDTQRGLFSFWKEVFQLPTSKKHTLNQGPLRMGATTGSHGNSVGHLSTNAGRFHNILHAASATGESDKIANGLFENYLLARVRDPNLEAVSVAQDWLVFHDHMISHIQHSQDYLFMTYLPFLSVAFHFLFASSTKAHLKYPNTSYEVFLRTQCSEHLLSSLLLETTPTVRTTINSILLVTEILPPLAEIIAPTFRPVSIQLYSAQEKQQLLDLVDTMISYNLTYRQEKGPDGQYTYVLNPNIEDLCRFPGLPQRKQLSYSAKQLISREVEMEKMRRAERFLNTKLGGSPDNPAVVSNGKKEAKAAQAKKIAKKIVEEKPPTDFFGRPVTPSRAKGAAGRAGGANHTHPLWFKFNEGYSNAVRRPIKIKTLL